MTQQTGSHVIDPEFANLIERLSQALDRGEQVDIDQWASEHPEYADDLRSVWPALEVLRQLTSAEVSRQPGTTGNNLSVAAYSSEHTTPADPHSNLGDFRIVREIGRGGMGVVYEAEQISLSRRIALKVLPFASVLDATRLARFKNESLAAAQLDHPHIVHVHGTGCERGVHFYAMQYVEGRTLADLVEQMRANNPQSLPAARDPESEREAGAEPAAPPPTIAYEQHHSASPELDTPCSKRETTPLAKLSTEGSTKSATYLRAVTQIGVHVAEALDHAHQHGIVHRDIKPSNLILDEQTKVWVTDFGLAHIEVDASLTMTGDILGTLRYMSPEQALAKRVVIDHRTDIYSLGVTLYELLTLQPAFSGNDPQKLLQQVAFDEPVTPRSLNQSIPPDVETIVLKAMSKNPAERFDTAQELADDLQRFCDDKPIQAKRPSLVKRVAKWSRRHKQLVTSVGISVAVVSLLAVTTLIISYVKINNASKRAEANLVLVWQTLERVFPNLANESLSGSQERQSLLELAETYEKFAEENAAYPSLFTGRAHIRIGEIRDILGEKERAEKSYRTAIEILEDSGPSANPDNASGIFVQGALSEALFKLGDLLAEKAKLDQTERLYQRATSLWEELVVPPNDTSEMRLELSKDYYKLANLYVHMDRPDDAIDYYVKAIEAVLPHRDQHLGELTEIYSAIGRTLDKIGTHDDALELLKRARRIQAHLPPAVTIADASVTEGDSGITELVFSLTRHGNTSQATTVKWFTEDGTATANDYKLRSGRVTFLANDNTPQSISVPVNGDTSQEVNETILVKLSDISEDGAIIDGTAIGTILNDDVSISIDDVTVTEGDESIRFIDTFIPAGSGGLDAPLDMVFGPDGNLYVGSRDTNEVLRYNATTGALVDVFVSAGSGGLGKPRVMAFGSDGNLYVVSGTTNSVLRYQGPGAASPGEFINEFVLSGSGGLDRAHGLVFGSDGNLYVGGRFNDGVLRYDGTTGEFIDAFVSTGSGGLNRPSELGFGTDGNLYIVSTGSDSILRYQGPGAESPGAFIDAFVPTGGGGLRAPISFTIGPDGNLYVSCSGSCDGVLRYNGSTGAFIDAFVPTGSGGLDNAAGPNFDSAGNLYVLSAATDEVLRYGISSQAVFTVSLSSPSASAVTVGYSTADITAVAGSDYTATSGTLTFAPGTTTRTIIVPTIHDVIDELQELFALKLANASGATVADDQGLAIIVDEGIAAATVGPAELDKQIWPSQRGRHTDEP